MSPISGEIRTKTEQYKRKGCDYCGEPATKQFWFLLENFRRNPASKAYGRDDCSWCCDLEVNSCANPECVSEMRRAPDGYFHGCTEVTLGDGNAHLFHRWVEVKS